MSSYLRGAGHSTCKLCKGQLHPGINCREARHRRGEEHKRAEELDSYIGNDIQPYYSYSDSPQAVYVHQSNTGYYDEQDWYDESDDLRLTQSLSYQEEYEYDDYYNDYSQPSYQDYQVEYYNHQHEYSQPAYEDHQSHKSESLDEMMRKRHMAHIEQEMTKPHLSREDRLELLEWKYDLLPKEVKEVRPGMSTWEKRQAKQEWLSMQIEQILVEESKVEHAMSDEEGKVVTPPEFEVESLKHNEEYIIEIIIEEPPMEDTVEQTTKGKEINEGVPTNIDNDMCLEMRKVTVTDIRHIIKKWFCNNPTCVLRLNKKVCLWHVNYRAFVGNSVGKCGCNENLNMTKHIHYGKIKYRAYIGNVKGKCALKPP